MDNSIYFISLFGIIVFVSTILVLTYVEKRPLKTILLIMLFAFIAAVIGVVCAGVAMNYVYDYGNFWFPFFSFMTAIVWAIFSKFHFNLKKRSLPLVALLPACFLMFYFISIQVYENYRRPIDNAKHDYSSMQMGATAFFRDAQTFKMDCGRYPESLKEIIKPVASCPNWTGWQAYNYINGEKRVFDPWNHEYIYKVLAPDSIEVGSLGANGAVGGDENNRDFFVK
jgi:hypothetical protein